MLDPVLSKFRLTTNSLGIFWEDFLHQAPGSSGYSLLYLISIFIAVKVVKVLAPVVIVR